MNSITAALIAEIQEETGRRRRRTAADTLASIGAGDITTATGDLLFHTEPGEFAARLDEVLDGLAPLQQRAPVAFLVKLAIDLQSYLPEWRLRAGLGQDGVDAAAARVLEMLKNVEASEGQEELEADLHSQAVARIIAEGVEDQAAAKAEADALFTHGWTGYVEAMVKAIRGSNLYQTALNPAVETEIGNDYAVFLQHVLWLGGSFCTTNPVLIKLAWDIDPRYWDGVVDAIIGQVDPGTGGDEKELVETINSKLTMAVVLENCRLLRDIFLVTEGRQGYVSLQVNPTARSNPEGMAAEAKQLYAELREQLGGVPNVVFKLPSTSAGLAAAKILTADGIGVTITLTFSVFQAKRFAEVLQRGTQLVSYIAIMNGRMAYPVRDELSEAEVTGGAEAARWAGVEVARKSARILYDSDLGIDGGKVKIMIASLRIYEGEEGGWIPDVSELWGIPLITVFPNVRRTFDGVDRKARPGAVNDTTPGDAMKTMAESTIFRQAWWLPGDGDDFCPDPVLTLETEDDDAVLAWPPVRQTFDQFIDFYRRMGEAVTARIAFVRENKGQ